MPEAANGHYRLIVIGAGSAGFSAAITACEQAPGEPITLVYALPRTEHTANARFETPAKQVMVAKGSVG